MIAGLDETLVGHMSKFELDLSGPVLKLYMGWKIPFSMSRNGRVLCGRQVFMLWKGLLLGIQDRMSDEHSCNAEDYGE